MDLLVATRNPGKKREFEVLLAPLEATLLFPADIGLELDISEDASTYAENARQKALTYASETGLPTLADDSGLEVDALDGAPGIRSARFAEGSDTDRIEALLAALRGIPMSQRAARFRCVIVATVPNEGVVQHEGVCEGLIARQAAGTRGFGYDPVFYLPNCHCTLAQLSQEEKNRVSHRALATQTAMPALRHMLARGEGLRR